MKWIGDPNPAQDVPIPQIFRPEHLASGFGSGLHHHRIPEAQLGLFAKRDRAKHIIRRRSEHLPDGELPHTVSGFIVREGLKRLFRSR